VLYAEPCSCIGRPLRFEPGVCFTCGRLLASEIDELAAVPLPVHGLSQRFADALYNRAQQLDEWPGESYEGTSGLGGAKACCERGYYDEYRWAFGADDAMQAISHYGPVVAGIPWLEAMFEPHPSGLLEVDGAEAGGHEILARGHLLRARLKGEGSAPLHVVRLRNSWGTGWGAAGDCYMRAEDFDRLLKMGGDVVVPVRRTRPKA
jgi:hypothetical protein